MRIIAHRGAPALGRIENTVPAISSALAGAASGVEVDLRRTADGVFAACHDLGLLRLAGRDVRVAATPWTQLHAAAAASGVPLARLEEVLAVAAGRPVVLELKPDQPGAGSALVERLAQLAALGLPFSATISSFDPTLLSEVRAARRGTQLRTALLGRPGVLALATARLALAGGHEEVHPHVSDLLADPGAAREATGSGLEVVPWTVNSSRMIRRCAELGCAGVITDLPRKARVALAGRQLAA
jgi:glycerophosphoryl diester phosphodiesterase